MVTITIPSGQGEARPGSQIPFRLDAKLGADSSWVGESALCELRLVNDARYPWLLLVPRRLHIREAFELPALDQRTLALESNFVSQMMQELFSPDKLNVGALGNVVQQLHVHHVARWRTDLAWPGPVWGHSPALPYGSTQLATMLMRLRASRLGTTFPYNM